MASQGSWFFSCVIATCHLVPSQIMLGAFSTRFHSAPQPKCRFNANANMGHNFGSFMARVGTHALRAPATVNFGVERPLFLYQAMRFEN